jgi:replicative DNA helicase
MPQTTVIPISTAPERYLISALLDLGMFQPATYGIADHDIRAHGDVYRWCLDYQQTAGMAPPPGLVVEAWPTFQFHPGVDLTWAVAQVKEKTRERMLRASMCRVAELLQEGDVPGAEKILADHRNIGGSKIGVQSFEEVLREAAASQADPGLPVPWDSLGRLTGGIRPGNLWYVASRFGHGKSWILAAMTGWILSHTTAKVHVLSLEMSATAMVERVSQVLLRETVKGVDNELVKRLRSHITGKCVFTDPRQGRIDSSKVAALAAESDLVVIDYVGLMTNSGNRAVEDWRTLSMISQDLAQAARETGTPILAAAQLNRTADQGPMPTAGQLAQSDGLGRDADVVLVLRAYGTVMGMSLDKNRHGEGGMWFTEFKPATGQFEEVSKLKAETARREFESRQLEGW